MKRLTVCGLWVMAMGAAGCGSGVEPLSAFNPASQTPQLSSLPIPDALVSQIVPFSESGATTANDGFNITTITGGQSVVAPAAGVVSYVDLTPGAAIVYIIHNPHLMTRISLMQSASVQVGQNVQALSGVGLSPTIPSSPVHFTVFFDNTIVCPLTFMSFAEQKLISARSTSLSPCL